MNRVERARALLAGLWAGVLLAVAGIATPAPFATLATADAGRVVARVLASEAYLSLAAAVVLFLLERRRARDGAPAMTAEVMLVLGALLCTVAGYFALQPMMAAARAGQGPWSFGTLHAVSTVFFGVKALLVLVLAWRCTAAGIAPR
ncbi:DUF4149 domain-containing protein [Calidifontimicrobium sp. SYSU G02091]|uniref:DUF4149 domain-containing protein n=1 Tax=Calidifontimicrobium sp. SYSU G02091 TaxID=2926421 RepID=UPI001F53DE1A|nr:DUF4149 domain-containing protein [Calidifontimicrobium sp. SYSU G02091]MCI1192778.1 DUF4149 domain-containing protein [Calidifontimicrobium sp. SYSU G02091]